MEKLPEIRVGAKDEKEFYKSLEYGHHAAMSTSVSQAPVFYRKQAHFFRMPKDIRDQQSLEQFTFTVAVDGTPAEPKQLRGLKLPALPSGENRLASCVLHGLIYLFVSTKKDGKYSTVYHLFDGRAWQQGRIDLGISGSVRGHGRPVRVVTFLDAIYIFSIDDGQVAFHRFDGQAAPKRLGWMGNRAAFSRFFNVAAAVQTRNGKSLPVLVFAGQRANKPEYLQVSLIDPDHKVLDNVAETHMTYAEYNGEFGMWSGSMLAGLRGNAVQMFFQPQAHVTHGVPRRIEFDLDKRQLGAWKDTGIHTTGHGLDLFSIPRPWTKDNFRSYLTFLTYRAVDLQQAHIIATCHSDTFELVRDTKKLTVLQNDERGTHALLGVIEGVPPFTRNGHQNHKDYSVIKYGRASSHAIEVSQTTRETIGLLGSAGGDDNPFNMSSDLEAAFETTNSIERKITKSSEWTFASDENNPEGQRGWLMLSVPGISNRNYVRKDVSGTKVLGTFTYTWIDDFSILREAFELKHPTSDLARWSEEPRDDDDQIKIHKAKLLQVNHDGGQQKVGLKITRVSKTVESGSHRLSFSSGVKIKNLFGLTARGSFEVSATTTVTSSVSDDVEAAVSLPKATHGHQPVVKELLIQPYWMIPVEYARFERNKRPRWVPEGDFNPDYTPWCITWSVKAKT